MASTKKTANTSKTAHVMNLLSRGLESAPADAAKPAPAPAAEAQPAPRPESVTPPIISSFNSDIVASTQIKNALEDALTAELSEAGEPAPVVEGPVLQVNEEAAPPPQEEPAPEAAPAPVKEEPPAPPAPKTTYINVMQVLVEENAERYIKLFGLCPCNRCVADVKAVALNNLQPKYVVMPEGEVVPRISVYEGRFISAVTAQLLRACNVVHENPRHDL